MDRQRIKIDQSPIKLRIESEPYVLFLGKKYAAVIDVYEMKQKREYFLIVEAQSLALPLRQLEVAEGKLKDLVLWVSKESSEKFSKYDVMLA